MSQVLYQPAEPEPVNEDPRERILKPPSCRLDSEGASIVGLIYDVAIEPQREYGTGQVLTTKTGALKNVCLVKVLVVTPDGSVNVKSGDAILPVQSGDTVTCWMSGARLRQWDEASRKLPQGVTVGTRIRWVFINEEPVNQAGYNPRKNYELALEARDDSSEAWRPWNDACDARRAEYEEAVQLSEAETHAAIEGYTKDGDPLLAIPGDEPRKMGVPSGPIGSPPAPPPR